MTNMYKTIRHGENSLQYTILPQNDDFRIEGKLTNASSNNCTSGKSKSKRSARRRSFFAYLGVLFVCTVIIGAVLVPFLVSAECLPNPSDWFLKTKAALTGSTRRFGASSLSSTTPTTDSPSTTTDSRNNDKLIDSTIQSYPVETSIVEEAKISDPQLDVGASRSVTTTACSNNNGEPTKESESKNGNDFVAEVRFESLRGQMTAAVAPTIVVTTVRNNDQNKAVVAEGEVFPTIRATTIATIEPIIVSNRQNMTSRVMKVPLLKSASKKPIIPPVLAKTNSIGRDSENLLVKDYHQPMEKDKKDPNRPTDWIRSHWPYVDPSSYFQWPGYKTEDSVLLPAILGIALIVVITVIALCLVARNKRSIVSSVRKRNLNDIEEASEDNKTLLTNSNLSDDD